MAGKGIGCTYPCHDRCSVRQAGPRTCPLQDLARDIDIKKEAVFGNWNELVEVQAFDGGVGDGGLPREKVKRLVRAKGVDVREERNLPVVDRLRACPWR